MGDKHSNYLYMITIERNSQKLVTFSNNFTAICNNNSYARNFFIFINIFYITLFFIYIYIMHVLIIICLILLAHTKCKMSTVYNYVHGITHGINVSGFSHSFLISSLRQSQLLVSPILHNVIYFFISFKAHHMIM